jgi:hypothetical protein
LTVGQISIPLTGGQVIEDADVAAICLTRKRTNVARTTVALANEVDASGPRRPDAEPAAGRPRPATQ